jgi:hypothetical protein
MGLETQDENAKPAHEIQTRRIGMQLNEDAKKQMGATYVAWRSDEKNLPDFQAMMAGIRAGMKNLGVSDDAIANINDASNPGEIEARLHGYWDLTFNQGRLLDYKNVAGFFWEGVKREWGRNLENAAFKMKKIRAMPSAPDNEKMVRAIVLGCIKDLTRVWNNGYPQLELIKAADEIKDAMYRLGNRDTYVPPKDAAAGMKPQ